MLYGTNAQNRLAFEMYCNISLTRAMCLILDGKYVEIFHKKGCKMRTIRLIHLLMGFIS